MSSILGRGDHELRVIREHGISVSRFRVGRLKRTTVVVFPNGGNMHTRLPVVMSSSSPESQNQRGKEFKSSPPCHAIFKYLIPTLVALLALKYNGKTQNPFDAHPANMWTFFIATCIYCLALGFFKAKKINCEKTYSQILGYVLIISGIVSCVSLVSTFLPNFLGLLVLWVFLPIILAGVLLKRVIFCYIRQRIANAIDWVQDKFNLSQRIANAINWVRNKLNFGRRDQMEQPSLPI